MKLRLIEPTPRLADEYEAFLRDFRADGSVDYALPPDDGTDVLTLIRRLRNCADGLDLPNGWVPWTTFWLVSEDERLLGQASLRHRLTPALEDFGGHIGYGIRPGERKMGFGTVLLELVLQKARDLGLERVLLTCDPANVGSARIIQKNGGRLMTESASFHGRMTSRYEIFL